MFQSCSHLVASQESHDLLDTGDQEKKGQDAKEDAAGHILFPTRQGFFRFYEIRLLLISFVVFWMVKVINGTMNKVHHKEEEPEEDPEPTKEEVLLTEIRDLLKAQQDAGDDIK